MQHVCVIAEAGVNHNGDISLAKKLIEEAHKAGADYVKFQTFNADKLVSKYAPKAEYQKETTGADESQLNMLCKLSLSYDEFRELKAFAGNIGIGFISTPFDLDSIDFLESLDMDFWKVPSGEITNLPYLQKIAHTGRRIIMSTGMCEMSEIDDAIAVLEKNGSGEIILLHCNTQYPTPMEDVNLKAMDTIGEKTGKKVGYSDHTVGIEVPIAAVARGAVVIEKHFTLDKHMEGPDHKASLEPSELKCMIDAIRNIEIALGDGEKKRTVSETQNCQIARKSIVAARTIKAGEKYTEENLTVKRPGTGISPMRWKDVVGQIADRDYKEDELIIL